jgi:hypothetical protein
LPPALNANTKTRTGLLDRLRETFPNLKIASLMGDREFIGDAWMVDLSARTNPFRSAASRDPAWPARRLPHRDERRHRGARLDKAWKMILKGWSRLGQGAGDHSPLVRLVVMRLHTGELLALACASKPALSFYRQRWTIDPPAHGLMRARDPGHFDRKHPDKPAEGWRSPLGVLSSQFLDRRIRQTNPTSISPRAAASSPAC